MKKPIPILEFCDSIEIIHMASRTDRLAALRKQLLKIGIPLEHEKVNIPFAPTPEDANGFPSRGVHGNFLSHLDILTRAMDEKRRNVLVLEDDAIFRSQFNKAKVQGLLVDELYGRKWDFCFIGHSVSTSRLTGDAPIVEYRKPFKWSHCYLVNSCVLPSIVRYLNEVLNREPGHPEGSKMYIDGALSMYRQLNPSSTCLVTKPCMSVQAGSPSGLAGGKWYDRRSPMKELVSTARAFRDEIWRRTGFFPTT